MFPIMPLVQNGPMDQPLIQSLMISRKNWRWLDSTYLEQRLDGTYLEQSLQFTFFGEQTSLYFSPQP